MSIQQYEQNQRIRELGIIPKRDCCGCSACYAACPTGCIEMRADVEGFLFPVITDMRRCISCKKCEQVCPARNVTQQIALTPNLPVAFAVINKDEQVRRQSASGGVFHYLQRRYWQTTALCSVRLCRTIARG